MTIRSTSMSVLLAASGVVVVGIGLVLSAPWLMGVGLLLTVASGVTALIGAFGTTAPGSPRGGLQRPQPQKLARPAPILPNPASSSADGHARGPGDTSSRPRHRPRDHSADSRLLQPIVRSTELFEPQGPDPHNALEALARNASRVSSVLAVHLWMVDQSTQTLRLVDAVGDASPPGEPIAIRGNPTSDAIDRGVAILVHSSERSDEALLADTWRYVLPLTTPPARGAAVIDFGPGMPDRDMLTHVSAHSNGYLSAALALHVSQTETAAAGALLEAVAEIVRLVDEPSILQATLTHATELSTAHTASIMLVDQDNSLLRIRASRGLPKSVVSQTAVAEGEGIVGWVLATGKSMVVEDMNDLGPRSRRHGIRSAVAVPIADDQGIMGVLNVGSRTFHARFSSTQVSALESLGRVLALALRNARAHAASLDLYLETVKALALALETKDPYTQGATERILDLSTRLGGMLGMRGAELHGLRIAALVHDIGMAAAGDLYGLDDRPLSTAEWGMLKLHPIIAADVLSQAPSLRAAVPIVYHHHERFDGGGYVQGLVGSDIPLGARVLAVADSYVAMTSPRAYRKALTHDQALRELVAEAGRKYDPNVVNALEATLVGERTSP